MFDADETTIADGTGFGPAIVNRIVDAHGWEMRICEGLDGGGKFRFSDVEPPA